MITDIINKYIAITNALLKSNTSVNEISLTAIKTISLSSVKKQFEILVEEQAISQEKYSLIFSEPVITELRPYKKKLMNLEDTELGIVSYDYLSDIISYIVGVKLYSASSSTAWSNAQKLVESMGIRTDMVDINKKLPVEAFIGNNIDLILDTYINNTYHHAAVPVRVHASDTDGQDFGIAAELLECEIPENASVDTVKSLWKDVIREFKEDAEDHFRAFREETDLQYKPKLYTRFRYSATTTKLIEDIARCKGTQKLMEINYEPITDNVLDIVDITYISDREFGYDND